MFEVGKPFPGPIPPQEGGVMEMWRGGPVVTLQLPGLTPVEKKAFKASFREYGYLETSTPVPVAIWIFMFSKKLGELDFSFNARPVNREWIEEWMEPENGQVKNLIQFYLLDGPILKGIKAVGLEPEAIELFHATIRKQLSVHYPQSEFDKYLQGAYKFTTQELFQMGRKFTHEREKL
jgi:hypothetical protein